MNRLPSIPTALRLLLSVLLLAGMALAGPGASAAVTPDGSHSPAAPARLAALSGPVADFAATPTSGLAPLGVDFANTSAGTYTSCLWEFGDGKSTTKDNPSHRYQKSGVYTVTLTVTDDATGLSSSETKPGYIVACDSVTADFSAEPTSGVAPLDVTFSNSSCGDHTSNLWDFGDGITSTLESPSHIYQAPGVYTVILTIDGPSGSDTETKPSYVSAHTPVQAGFSAAPAEGVAPLEVAFTNTSTGDYATSLWDFGDGITSTLESPTHTYQVPGVYTVTLTVEGPGGTDTAMRPELITVYTPVVAGFAAEPLAGVSPLEVAFTNTTTGDYDTSLWDFGDGVTSTLVSPVHTYEAPGVYTVTLGVQGPGGSDSETKPEYVAVAEPVVAAFTGAPLSGLPPLEVAFTNTSTGDYTTSLWDFGDGITSTLESPTHTYEVPGVYTVTLTADGPGGTDTATEPAYITIYAPPEASLTASPPAGVAPLEVAFGNTSTGDYDASLWDFGDGITSTLESPTHTYQLPGVYTVTLTVDGPGGADTTVCRDCVTVYTPAQAGLSGAPRSGAVPLLVAFTNASTGDYATSLWDFGDGITSTLESPTHTYQVPGVYTVSLTVDGPGGTDSATEPGYVIPFAEVPDAGPHDTDIAVQNLHWLQAEANLALTTSETGTTYRYDLGAAVAGSSPRFVSSSDLAPDETGPWTGSGELLATKPVAAVVHMFWNWESGLRTAGTYGSYGPPATTSYLPWLPVENGCLTSIIVQNTEDAEAQVQLAFYDRSGSEKLTHSVSIPPKAESTFSLAELWPDFSATAYQGTARITADRQIATVVNTHRQDAYSEVYAGVPSGDTVLWVPGVFREQPSPGVWNHSAVIVQNLGSAAASVHVEFINPDGSPAHALDDAIAPLGGAEYNTNEQGSLDAAAWQALVAALGDSWQGTVKVAATGGQPLAGVCVHARGGAGTTDRLAYNAIRDSASTVNALAFPAMYRNLLGDSSDLWSAAIVQNKAGTAGTLSVQFFGADGLQRGDTYTVSIPAKGSVRLNLSSGQDLPQAALDALGTSFSGAMRVTPSEGVRVVGVNHLFWVGAGRAAAYSGFPMALVAYPMP